MKRFSQVLLVLLAPLAVCAQKAPEPAPAGHTLSVDYPGIEIRKLLAEVAQAYGKTLHLKDDIRGRTSVKLRDVTWRQIYAVVLRPIQYDFYETENEIHVLSEEEMNKLPWQERTIEVLFQDPGELAQALAKRSKAQATLGTEPGTLVLRAHPKDLSIAMEMIEQVDRPDVRLNRFPRKPNFPSQLPAFGKEGSSTCSDDPRLNSTCVLFLAWVDCETVQALVTREIPGLAKVICDHRSNTLIVSGPQDLLDKAASLTAYLDDRKWYTAK